MLVLSKYSSHVQYFSVVIGGSVVGSCLVVGALVVGAADVGTAVVGAADVGASEVGAAVVPSLMQSSNNGVRGPPQVLQSLSGSVRRLHCFAELLNTQYLQPIASNWSQSSSHSFGSAIVPTGGSRRTVPVYPQSSWRKRSQTYLSSISKHLSICLSKGPARTWQSFR